MKKIKYLTLFVILAVVLSLAGCSSAVSDVEQKIKSIGNVTLSSVTAITEAEIAFSELTEEDQKKVKNYNELKQARSRLDLLTEQVRIVDLSKKIITKMGKIYKKPLQLTINNVWYYGSYQEFPIYLTFELTSPNGYGTMMTSYYGITLYNDDEIKDLDDMLNNEVGFYNILGSGVRWREDSVTAMQGGTQLTSEEVTDIQNYYMRNYR